MKKLLFYLGFSGFIFVQGFAVNAQTVEINCSSLDHCEISQYQAHRLEAQAQQFYDQNQYDQSLKILQQLLTYYQAENNTLGRVRVLRNQSLIYLKQNQLSAAAESIFTGLKLIPDPDRTPEALRLYASILAAQAQLQLLKNDPESALKTGQESAEIYRDLNQIKSWTRTQINQTQALQALGLYSKAFDKLVTIEQQLSFQPDSLLKAKSLHSLGDVLRETGQLKQSDSILLQSLQIAETLQNSEQVAMILLSLGKTATLQNEFEAADQFYQTIIDDYPLLKIQLKARLNQFDLYLQNQNNDMAIALIPEIEKNLNQLSDSVTKIQGQIYFAKSLMRLTAAKHPRVSNAEIAQYLNTAIQMAQSFRNQRLESYGIGVLGRLYQQNQQWDEAQKLTEKALQISQSMNADDITYQWQWQLGQILKAQNQPKRAVNAYTQAWENLKLIRGDIVTVHSEVQFNFREQVEPIYRELVDLLLSTQPSQEDLKKARSVIESLQLAELDNFFQNACLDTKPVNVDEIDPTAAVIYTINLSDRIEMIVAIANQPLQHYTVSISETELAATLQTMQEAITLPRKRIFLENYLEPAEKMYNALIRPLESDLETYEVETLVFILDSGLRNLSMASLFDGQNYLIENYNIAVAPSLQLIDPRPSTGNQLDVLAAGLTEARQDFSPLPSVKLELEQIHKVTQSQTLLNESFTKPQLNKTVTQHPFSVVHLATHGKFSSQLEETFIIAWDRKINIENLRTLLKSNTKQLNPIELLVLSACQTAVGDERAGLGLAGVAVRSGARSTLASFWSVNDQSTALLMSYFYKELSNPQLKKAEALRYAQLKLLQQKQFAHPFFWSGFVLVGNWL